MLTDCFSTRWASNDVYHQLLVEHYFPCKNIMYGFPDAYKNC